ncbi:MAG TPA: alpha/beta fold hydrolase [Acidimicrobiales bacterium]
MVASPAAVVRASRRWAQSYPLAPRYRPPALPLRLLSADRTRLSAVWVPGPAGAIATVVVVHGFTNWSRSREVRAAVGQLSTWAHVVALDLRGHGRSAGRSTFGVAEPDDVAAAVAAGRALAPALPVVTLGISLGGASSLFAAGGGSPVAGVVAVSAPAWRDLTSPAGVRLARWTRTRRGRVLILALSGTRVDPEAGEPGDLRRAVAAISPAFVVIAHDPQEAVFGPEHAEALFAWAGEPKALWWVPGGGHGRSMLTPELLERVRVDVSERLGPEPAPTPGG